MSEILKITLSPLDKFFFGGEVVFGADGGQGERRRSYLVHSNVLPQQTTLLGMLREQLLRQNGLLLQRGDPQSKRDNAKNLVGKTGFQITIDKECIRNPAKEDLEPFGVVSEISSLFLEGSDGNLWQAAPLDDVWGKDERTIEFAVESDNNPVLKNFNPKDYLKLHFSNSGQERKALEDFFNEETKVGVLVTNRRKWREGMEDDKEGFFRQTFKKNIQSNFANALTVKKQRKNPVSFVFYAKMTSDFSNYKFGDALVTMGGERSCFQMKVEKVDLANDFENLFHDVEYQKAKMDALGYRRIVLMSDTYADPAELKKYCALIVANPVSFRFFSTILDETEDFYDFKKENYKGRKQSNRYTLLRRGGVLYVHEDKLAGLQAYLKEQTTFRQIGYNFFKTV